MKRNGDCLDCWKEPNDDHAMNPAECVNEVSSSIAGRLTGSVTVEIGVNGGGIIAVSLLLLLSRRRVLLLSR